MTQNNVQLQNGNGPLAGLRNLLVNGDFNVWQRGTDLSFTGSNEQNFGPDRWYLRAPVSVGGGATECKLIRDGGYNKCRIVYNGTPTGQGYIGYRIEAQDVMKYAGSQMTLSFNLENVSMATAPTPTVSIITKQSGNVNTELVPNTQALSYDGGTQYSVTFTCSTGNGTWQANNEIGMIVLIWINGTNNVVANACQLWNAQLEPGPVITPYEELQAGLELSLCQRYYQLVDSTGGPLVLPVAAAPSNPSRFWQSMLTTTMRVTPTISSGTATNFQAGPTYQDSTAGFLAIQGSASFEGNLVALYDVVLDAEL